MIWKICYCEAFDMRLITFTLVYLDILYINYFSKLGGLLEHNDYVYKIAKKRKYNKIKTPQQNNAKIKQTNKNKCNVQINMHTHTQTNINKNKTHIENKQNNI
jgi:hypothetical protein